MTQKSEISRQDSVVADRSIFFTSPARCGQILAMVIAGWTFNGYWVFGVLIISTYISDVCDSAFWLAAAALMAR